MKNLASDNWKAKFKAALDINDPEAKRYYDEFLAIRNQVRNFVAHGSFGKEGEAFLFHSDAGAVPVKLPHREGKHSYRFLGGLDLYWMDRAFVDHEAIALIKQFIDFIRSGPLAPAWIYLDSGLNLVLTMARSGEYGLAMASEDAMDELVDQLSNLDSRNRNMDF